MATINKIMKTFNVPDGSDVKRYEIVDDAGRKCIALDWYENTTRAFAIDEFVVKDGIVYRFTETHTANTAWNASQVTATNYGAELTALKNNLYAEFQALDNAVKSGTKTDKNYHLGFYLDSDGDVCQAD